MAEDVKHVDRWEWCDVMRAYVNYQDGQYVLASDYDALRAERDAAIRGEHRTDDTQPTWAELVTYWRGRAQRAEAQAAELAQALAEMLELRTASIECRIMDRHELDIVRDARAALARAGKGE